MLNRKPKPNLLNAEKQRLLVALAAETPGTDKYNAILDELSKLDKLFAHATPVSNDTKASIAANFAGLLLIVNHERANIIATKALTMLPKLRS